MKKMNMRKKEAIHGLLFVSPWIMGFLVFTLYPICSSQMFIRDRSNTEGIHSYNENVDIEDAVNAGRIYIPVSYTHMVIHADII